VTRDNERIQVRAKLMIAAPTSLVFQALTDYEHFSDLSSRYIESRFIEPGPNGQPRIYTQVEGCVWLFCRTVGRYAQLNLNPNTHITATVEPEESDVSYGVEVWELEAVQGGTQVSYRHDMEPKFWVPPVVGLWAIRRALNKDALSAAERIEALAQPEASGTKESGNE
jgi:hypothetical protein